MVTCANFLTGFLFIDNYENAVLGPSHTYNMFLDAKSALISIQRHLKISFITMLIVKLIGRIA